MFFAFSMENLNLSPPRHGIIRDPMYKTTQMINGGDLGVKGEIKVGQGWRIRGEELSITCSLVLYTSSLEVLSLCKIGSILFLQHVSSIEKVVEALGV